MKSKLLLFSCFLLICFFSKASVVSDTTKKSLPIELNFKANDYSKNCKKYDAVIAIIAQAIEIGAPTYNLGNHIGCYMIYEGAAYKIIYHFGSKCDDILNTLKAALEQSYSDKYNVTEKAWIMRMAFDQILGDPTITK
jgi:hypothetical protein